MFEPDQVHYHAKLAMKMGGRYAIRDIALSATLRAQPSRWASTLTGCARSPINTPSGIPAAITQAIDEADGLVTKMIATKMKVASSNGSDT